MEAYYAHRSFKQQLEPFLLDFLIDLEITTQKRVKNKDKIIIVILEALGEATSLAIESFDVLEERIILTIEAMIEHDVVHVVVHHELETVVEDDAIGGSLWVCLDIINDSQASASQSNRYYQTTLLVKKGTVIIRVSCTSGHRRR